MKALKILTQGIVQGVGFRPYVYRLAVDLNLKGYVRNLGNVVEIIIEGQNTELFVDRLPKELPPIAKINSMNVEEIEKTNYTDFKIIESGNSYSGISVVPPDIAICDKCLEEIRNPTDRRYKYAFNACTDCGPRFTVIESVPYDRIRTSMDEFPLCDDCSVEYEEPLNRRYHGEAICCSECGPQMEIYEGKHKINTDNPIKVGANKLKDGKILAIKGIGGTHLVVDAYNNKAIKELRKRLNRPNQAFAVMCKDLESLQNYAELSKKEIDTISSNKRPIVILKKKNNYPFPESLSPRLHNIGVMLPYSPMHYLLFDEGDIDTYVMTSANIPGEPMMIENEDIINGINDYSLIHNRRILNRCDDSVIRFRNNELSFIRRSRGYTPEPYTINYEVNDLNILALGPELDVTFSIAKDNIAYPSQHIGNTNKPKTLAFLREAIENMQRITKINEYDIIACDMHPHFFTTKLAYELAEKYDAEVQPIQHHHAHSVALSNDNAIDEMIVIAADGVGYGSDGTSWGGEILYTDIKNFERLGHLQTQLMPGGDIATKYPARMLASILNDENLIKNYSDYFKYGEIEIKNIFKQMDAGINVGKTTSTGRVLDSMAVALEICNERTYEGECSMKLESAAYYSNKNIEIPLNIENNILNTSEILKEVVKLYQDGEKKADVAAAGQNAIARGLSQLAINAASKKSIQEIGATGGVFYNEAITNTVKNYVENNGFNFIQHKNTCAGDGSVSLGQAIIAKKV
ncbi:MULTISPECIES: carbamoyltransferase HypF [Methanobrevibacter]|uniref:Carbamoyltransferase n=1 Tax=Methanobrevibacter gottschalkii DSM 11977 TaxID=1122229 RepID=A0A3N5B5U3_9EURY|nr:MULTISPECIES: carbamoyltransferase HypF [Methanobrevibacter]OEC93963.1 carbamoyltransferase HypF [Methanobrevibacter sp. A27]RPF52703.1 hydrogenase maturation protein HypF [Methanobrevibacter gottschalkii DSM 11977]